MRKFINYITLSFFILSCDTGNLEFVADLPSSLKETSAIEIAEGSDLYWVIEDSGNKNELYGLNSKGKIVKVIEITNAKNKDWEDLTSDSAGNIYIGDFGNNSKKRKKFSIYKVSKSSLSESETNVDRIQYTLPDSMDSEDMESFFIYQNWFYIFTKNHKKTKLIKVPNKVGEHKAILISEHKLDGKHTRVTSADISADGNTVLLLNHDKVWVLSGFKTDDFFSGEFEALEFKHDSQKEGIAFLNEAEVFITDEQQHTSGGNIYKFSLIQD